jgi:hypothetical protein
MAEEKKTVYVVKVKGHPGHGARTYDKEYAQQAQEALNKRYKHVRIIAKRQR